MDASQIKAYRQLGLERLEQLLLALPDAAHASDHFVDGAIRKLSGLPPAPTGAPPYQGIYSSAFSMEEYRNGATSRLLELMLEKLAEFDALDHEVDDLIRQLSDLPAKPEGADPYVRLFILRESVPEPEVGQTEYAAMPSQEFVTLAQMLDIIGSDQRRDRVTQMMPGINLTLEKFDITSPLRIAHFFGQVLHESGGFRYLREIWGPTDAQRRYEPPSRLAKDLGNTEKGDGARYMGRGVIQLTGRYNYGQFSKAMGIDFVANPELVETPQYAVSVAGWYWQTRKINGPADRDDLLRVTRLVNGGTNGLEDRRRYLNRAKKVLGIG
jgi:putative chitinase